jgi:hypothetical protein
LAIDQVALTAIWQYTIRHRFSASGILINGIGARNTNERYIPPGLRDCKCSSCNLAAKPRATKINFQAANFSPGVPRSRRTDCPISMLLHPRPLTAGQPKRDPAKDKADLPYPGRQGNENAKICRSSGFLHL